MASNLRSGAMPPEEKKRPAREVTDKVLGEISRFLAEAEVGVLPSVVRRLNRAEYNNTVRDLFGIDLIPGRGFPFDPVEDGFDNNGQALTVPPILFEKYNEAAREVAQAVVQVADEGNVPLPPSPIHQKIFICVPTPGQERECATRIIGRLAKLAFRRPVLAREIDPLLSIFEVGQKESFARGIQLTIQALLLAPDFLFRIESDTGGETRPVNDYELASRLSYFIWSSMPDDELFQLADQGKLRSQLEPQVKRMLALNKPRGLTVNFAGQWTEIRPLKENFPRLPDYIKQAMFHETYQLFDYIAQGDRSILEFLDADYVIINEVLAQLYGIKGVSGNEFRRVEISDGKRGGLLSQASILTVTSNPRRTSPVKRGKWVLDNFLDDPPPDAPANIPPLERSVDRDGKKRSLRVQMEDHRTNPSCAVCHQRMDPLGFGLENYNNYGRWRQEDGDYAVDARGVLPSGESFQNPKELKTILKGMAPFFARCLTKKLLTYAWGRTLEIADEAALQKITQNLQAKNYAFSSLLLGVVKSDAFLMNRSFSGQTEVKK